MCASELEGEMSDILPVRRWSDPLIGDDFRDETARYVQEVVGCNIRYLLIYSRRREGVLIDVLMRWLGFIRKVKQPLRI